MGIKVKYLDVDGSKRIGDCKFYVVRSKEEKEDDATMNALFMVRACSMIECANHYGEVGSISIVNTRGEYAFSANVLQCCGNDIMVYVSRIGLKVKDLDGKIRYWVWGEIGGIGIDVVSDINNRDVLPSDNGSWCIRWNDAMRILRNLRVENDYEVAAAFEEVIGFYK